MSQIRVTPLPGRRTPKTRVAGSDGFTHGDPVLSTMSMWIL